LQSCLKATKYEDKVPKIRKHWRTCCIDTWRRNAENEERGFKPSLSTYLDLAFGHIERLAVVSLRFDISNRGDTYQFAHNDLALAFVRRASGNLVSLFGGLGLADASDRSGRSLCSESSTTLAQRAAIVVLLAASREKIVKRLIEFSSHVDLWICSEVAVSQVEETAMSLSAFSEPS
jgi:hypothetical protein